MTGEHHNRLAHLAAEIARAHAAAEAAAVTAAERAVAAGHALLEAKELVPHGAWLEWLGSAGVPERSARRYMSLARAGIKSATLADLGWQGAESAARFIAKAWPDEGHARLIEGGDGERHFFALVLRHRDAGFYAWCEGHHHPAARRSGGTAGFLSKPFGADFIARAHVENCGAGRICNAEDMLAERGERMLAAFGAHLVRHSWGTRLEEGAA